MANDGDRRWWSFMFGIGYVRIRMVASISAMLYKVLVRLYRVDRGRVQMKDVKRSF